MKTSTSHSRTTRTVLALALLLPALVLSACGGLIGTDKAADDSVATTTSRDALSDPDTGVAIPPEVAQDVPHGTATTTEGYGESGALPPSGGAGADASTVAPADRLVIRTVDLRLRVEEVRDAADAVRDAALKAKGLVVDYQVSTDEGVPIYRPYVEGSALADGAALSGYVTVRVPAASLDAFITQVADLGEVLRQAENESDVTQEHLDLTARLKNLQATEASLREFFGKAKNVTEMLAIEQELSRVRGEIEALQAQIAYLERQAAMSTVTVELTGPTPVVRPAGEDWGFVAALTQSVRAFVGTVNGIIVIAGALAPVAILGLAVFFPARSVFRRRRARRDSIVPEAAPADETHVSD